jgi:tetratricopeptide (TPR) repeat protein
MPDRQLERVFELKRRGDLDGALIALEGMLSSTPSPVVLANLAEVQLRRGKYDEAAAALDRAEAASGTTATTARLRGDLAMRAGKARLELGDLEGARGAAAQALERDETAAQAWLLLGDVERRECRLEEAEAMYAKAATHAPEDRWVRAKLLEARLLRLPPVQREREVAVLDKTLGREDPHVAGVLARMRSEAGDEAAAAATWRRRAEKTGDPYARRMLGFALRRAGELDEAAAVLGSCLLEDPGNVILFRTYVHLQHQRGALDELRHTLESLLPVAGGRRGAVYRELRRLPEPGADGSVGAGEAPKTVPSEGL